ncbi:MAG: hypothetical protein RIS97_576 [Pseudomonadota bacterium]
MSDRHWMILQELGGAEWLRKQLDKNAKMPVKYYSTFLKKETND